MGLFQGLKRRLGFSKASDVKPVKKLIFVGEALCVLRSRGGEQMVEAPPHGWRPAYSVKTFREWYFKNAVGEIEIDPITQASPHMLITGASGYGKSTLGKVMLFEIVKKVGKPVVVLDIHDEYLDEIRGLGGEVFDPRKKTLSLFELEPGVSPGEKAGEMVDVFSRVLTLGDIQAIYLAKAAEKAYAKKGIVSSEKTSWGRTPPTLQEVIDEVDLLANTLRGQDKSYVLGLRRRLSMLELSGVFTSKTTVPFDEIVSKPTAFALGQVRSRESQAMFLEVFLRKLAGYMTSHSKSNEVRVYCLFDEAHRVCVTREDEPSFAGVIAREARKYGIGLIALSQSAKELDKAIVSNAAMTFSFYPKEPVEAQYLSDLFAGGTRWEGLAHEISLKLKSLVQFECMMVTTNWREPVVVRVKPLWERPEAKSLASAAGKESVEAKPQEPAKSLILPRVLPSVEMTEPFSAVAEEQAILDKLKVKSPRRVTEFSREFGGSKTRFYEFIESLEKKRVLKVVALPDLHGRQSSWVGLPNPSKSVEHSAYLELISGVLSSKGIPFSILDKKSVPDIELEYGGQKIALEFESGKKKDDSYLKKMLEERVKKYKHVILVVPDEELPSYKALANSFSSVTLFSLKGFKEFPITEKA